MLLYSLDTDEKLQVCIWEQKLSLDLPEINLQLLLIHLLLLYTSRLRWLRSLQNNRLLGLHLTRNTQRPLAEVEGA